MMNLPIHIITLKLRKALLAPDGRDSWFENFELLSISVSLNRNLLFRPRIYQLRQLALHLHFWSCGLLSFRPLISGTFSREISFPVPVQSGTLRFALTKFPLFLGHCCPSFNYQSNGSVPSCVLLAGSGTDRTTPVPVINIGDYMGTIQLLS